MSVTLDLKTLWVLILSLATLLYKSIKQYFRVRNLYKTMSSDISTIKKQNTYLMNAENRNQQLYGYVVYTLKEDIIAMNKTIAEVNQKQNFNEKDILILQEKTNNMLHQLEALERK